MKELLVLNFINSHKNWEEVLSSPPYNIIIKKKEPFILLKYNQVEPKSDMSDMMVQECRGLILKDENGHYKVASMRFNKFFNYGQEEAATLKFPCIASEKIDGSLIGVWYDEDSGWHISTSGNIDAEDANMINVNGLSNFRDLFNIAWKNSYFDSMDKNLTYMFELVSPYNKLVVPYSKTKLYLLAIRNNITLEEFKIEDVVSRGKTTFDNDILYPKYFVCNNINEIKEKANALKDDSENWEGFVLCDDNFERIKLKSPLYTNLFFMRGDGLFGDKKILEIILSQQDDDILAYFPEYKESFERIRRGLSLFISSVKKDLQDYKGASLFDKKGFAERIKSSKNKSVLFLAYDYDYWDKDEDWQMNFIKDYIDKLYIHKLLDRVYEELL